MLGQIDGKVSILFQASFSLLSFICPSGKEEIRVFLLVGSSRMLYSNNNDVCS